MKRLLCTLGLAFCVGCATVVVRPYVGDQQNWPTAAGSIVNIRYNMPIFTTLPPTPYEILAEMRIESPLYAQPEESHLKAMCEKAKDIGADALMLVEGQVYFAAAYGNRISGEDAGGGMQQSSLTQVNRFNPESFKPGVNVVAIKWTGEPPAGLPKRHEKKQKAPETPVVTEAPAPPVAPVAPEPPKLEAPAAPAAPVAPEPPKMEQPAPPPPPVAPEPPKLEAPAPTPEPPAAPPVEVPVAKPEPAPTETAPPPANP